jgi:hypothetical protein
MIANQNSAFLRGTSLPFVRAIVNGYLNAHFLHRFYRLSAWLGRRWKKQQPADNVAEYEIGNEHFVGDGCYRISAAQARLERTIDAKTFILLLTSLR